MGKSISLDLVAIGLALVLFWLGNHMKILPEPIQTVMVIIGGILLLTGILGITGIWDKIFPQNKQKRLRIALKKVISDYSVKSIEEIEARFILRKMPQDFRHKAKAVNFMRKVGDERRILQNTLQSQIIMAGITSDKHLTEYIDGVNKLVTDAILPSAPAKDVLENQVQVATIAILKYL
jgi:hypothetical protein